MTIVVYTHRPKRPPPKQKASALARAAKAAATTKALPAIVTPTSEKLLKRLRAERTQHPRSLGRSPSGEPGPEVEAFFARNVRPGGPCRHRTSRNAGLSMAAAPNRQFRALSNIGPE